MLDYAVGRKPRFRRCPKNIAENLLFKEAQRYGPTPIKRGWPDFHMTTESGRFICVEIKPSKYSSVKFDQDHILTKMAEFGMDCYIWTPDGGYTKINKDGTKTYKTAEQVYM